MEHYLSIVFVSRFETCATYVGERMNGWIVVVVYTVSVSIPLKRTEISTRLCTFAS